MLSADGGQRYGAADSMVSGSLSHFFKGIFLLPEIEPTLMLL